MPQKPFFSTLSKRGCLKLSGTKPCDFLQPIITNDINMLDKQPIIYSCLLTAQGKFLYDFFISRHEDELWLDCEGGEHIIALAKLLNMYKLRAEISINIEQNVPIYAIFGCNKLGAPDPRSPNIGYRSFEKPADMKQISHEQWDKTRLKLCIPDGSRDMIQKKSTLLECGIDRLNGVSFDKGCYIGQELTARTHYRGLTKKHLYVVTPEMLGLSKLPDAFTKIQKDGHFIGEMRSSLGNIGLALLKDEAAKKLIST